jgi:CRP-like cAMP-binding protein
LPYFHQLAGSPGDRLYSQGDASGGLYVILEGVCVTLVAAPDGTQHEVKEIQESESFGELGLVLRGERLLSVEARTNVRLLALDLDSFRMLKTQNPDLCLMLIMSIVRRFGRVVDDSRELFQRMLLRQVSGVDEYTT